MLVHYLNVPSLEDSGKCSPLLCAVSDRHDSVRWSQEDLLSQLRPMCTYQIQVLPKYLAASVYYSVVLIYIYIYSYSL